MDDHALVRRGLAALLQLEGEYQVVAEADNGENAMQIASQVPADLMILDLSMPRLNGLEAIRRLKRQQPGIKILILSMYDDVEFVAQAIQNGVDGYLLKQSLEDELFEALDVIIGGGRYFGPQARSVRIQAQAAHHADFLTSRARSALQLISERASATENRHPALDQPAHRQSPPRQHHAKAQRPQPNRARASCRRTMDYS